jgi:16S rRNA (guanine527-N7)-methyltransferase
VHLNSLNTLAPVGLDVSRETLEKLYTYVGLIKKWNSAINLVSSSTLATIWERHILDSAQIFPLVPRHFIGCHDIGSGAGLPGLVLAIISSELEGERYFTLVEADLRKATFLREAARHLDLQVEVKAERTETLGPGCADVLTARALAPLIQLVGTAQFLLEPGGTSIFPKGERYRDEIAAAHEKYKFNCEIFPSKTQQKCAILRISEIEHV